MAIGEANGKSSAFTIKNKWLPRQILCVALWGKKKKKNTRLIAETIRTVMTVMIAQPRVAR